MAEVKNYQEVVDIASKHLGTVGGAGYKDTYAPELLVKIPRKLNREGYGLTGEEFKGVDVWNAYEVSDITNKFQQVSGILKIVCPFARTAAIIMFSVPVTETPGKLISQPISFFEVASM